MLVGEILTRNPHSTSHRPLVTRIGRAQKYLPLITVAYSAVVLHSRSGLPTVNFSCHTQPTDCNAMHRPTRTLITVTQIISTSTGPISTKFARLVKLWPSMNDLKLFFLSLKGCCRGNQFCGHNRPPSLILRMTFTRAAPAYKNGNCYARHRQTNGPIR